MNYEEMHAYISTYLRIRAIEENATKLSDFVNSTMPSDGTPDEQIEYFQSCLERFDPLTGLFEDK